MYDSFQLLQQLYLFLFESRYLLFFLVFQEKEFNLNRESKTEPLEFQESYKPSICLQQVQDSIPVPN